MIEMNVLRALADPTRMKIVQALAECGCGYAGVGGEPTASEVCCRITGADKITSTISHHLHELSAANLVTLQRRGKTTVCKLNPMPLVELSQALRQLAYQVEDAACQKPNQVSAADSLAQQAKPSSITLDVAR